MDRESKQKLAETLARLRLRAQEINSRPPEPVIEPVMLAYTSKAHMDVWTFCALNKNSWADWAEYYKKSYGREPDVRWFEEPETVPISASGHVSIEDFEKYQTSTACKLCWNTKVASVTSGDLKIDGVPQALVRVACPCTEQVTI